MPVPTSVHRRVIKVSYSKLFFCWKFVKSFSGIHCGENTSLRMYDQTPHHKASAIKDRKDYSIIWNDERFPVGSKIFVCLSYPRQGLVAGSGQVQYCPNKQYYRCQCPSLENRDQLTNDNSYDKPTCNTDLCDTQQWGLNLSPADLI